jgi:N-acetylglucosamine-6-phosphate deacetylase
MTYEYSIEETYALVGADVLLPGGILDERTVCVFGGCIQSVLPAEVEPDMTSYDVSGTILAPGFVDIHVNGGGGGSFEDGTSDAVSKILDTGLRYGTTSVLGALNTATAEDRMNQLGALSRIKNSPGRGEFLGAYLEGPYYSQAQRGAHHVEWIRDPDPAEYGAWLDQFGDLIRVVTLAPELNGGIDMVRALTDAGVIAAIGHSMARDDQVDEAIDVGARLVTHIYNAQSTFTRTDGGKHLGVAEMGLLRDALTVEIIPDNRHLTPRMQQLVIKAKPNDRVCITTDAMEATGQGPGTYEVMGGVVWVDDSVAYREDRTRHAGSILTMDKGVRNVVEAGASIGKALMMATEVPACTIGVEDRKGRLVEGADADIVLLDRSLNVSATISGGHLAYAAEGSHLLKEAIHPAQ